LTALAHHRQQQQQEQETAKMMTMMRSWKVRGGLGARPQTKPLHSCRAVSLLNKCAYMAGGYLRETHAGVSGEQLQVFSPAAAVFKYTCTTLAVLGIQHAVCGGMRPCVTLLTPWQALLHHTMCMCLCIGCADEGSEDMSSDPELVATDEMSDMEDDGLGDYE
jgi:hypothetical protein